MHVLIGYSYKYIYIYTHTHTHTHTHWRKVFSNPLPIFNGVICLLLLSWGFIDSGYKSLIRHMICKYFPTFCRLSTHHRGGIFWNTKVFYFQEVQFNYFFLLLLVLLVSYPRILCQIQDHDLSLTFLQNFIVFIHIKCFELLFIYNVSYGSDFIFCI